MTTLTAPKPPAPKPKPARKPPKAPTVAAKATTTTLPTARTFNIKRYDGTEGHRIGLYGDPGIGKTTLASMAPEATFIPYDSGGRKIHHPITGERLQVIENSDGTNLGYQDTRDFLHSPSYHDQFTTLVFDHITLFESITQRFVVETVPKKGDKMSNILDYGWGDGFRHTLDKMELILQDCDELARKQKNIIFIAQCNNHRKANSGGLDYLREGPDLQHNVQYSMLNLIHSWLDHTLRIANDNFTIAGDGKSKVGKASGELQRFVFCKEEPHFLAKSRTIEYPCVSFDHPGDYALWHFMFPDQTDLYPVIEK